VTPAGWIVAISVVLIAWVVAGYPLTVVALANHRPAPAVRREPITPDVTVVVAVRNGAAWLGAKLDSLIAQEYPRERIAVLVVSDGSTDDTSRVALDYARRDPPR
jgi:cellulose synthase/poly-beta-1,6-N-acetylglucosamine synthase-like glycosyltransferase